MRLRQISARAQHVIQYWMCAMRRLRSVCSFKQSNQILYCPHKDALDPLLPTECPLKTMVRLCNAQVDLSFLWVHIYFSRKYCVPDYIIVSTNLVSNCTTCLSQNRYLLCTYVQVLAFTKSLVYA